MPHQSPSLKNLLRGTGLFLLANLLIFFVYRSIFLGQFVEEISRSDSLAIFLSGLRLDLALLAFELFVVLSLALLTRFLYLRIAAMILATLTGLHVFVAAANLIFFHERNQHLWEMLFANISQPNEILNACEPYIKETPLLTALVLVCSLALVALGFWKTKSLSGLRIDLWSPRRRLRPAGAIWLLLLIVQLDRVDFAVRRGWTLGWIPLPTASHYYMRFDSYLANQSVINPLHDFVRFYLPAQFAHGKQAHEERLEPDLALAISQELLGIESPTTAQFPLQKQSQALADVGLTNLVLIQVEGLSQSMVHKTEGSVQIMPFLHKLSGEALYFPNLIQNYNATDGGVLSTATGTHKAFFSKDWKYFLPDEVNGYFASLPRILGKESYRHFALFGFRNRREDFATFFNNQGYTSMHLVDFKALDIPNSLNPLGLYDHVLFDVAVDVLNESPGSFSAHLITSTTHSPWAIPADEPHPFSKDSFNAFHYTDRCIEKFITSMRNSHPDFENTLFVVSGDHTSVTFGQGLMERLQIPLFIYANRLKPLKGKWQPPENEFFSQVDIVPTVLDLLDGAYTYSGLGRSILTAKDGGPGALSSNRYQSLYLKGDFAFRYSPFAPEGIREQLFEIRDGEIIEVDVSSDHPDEFQRLSREFFALYETSDRLAKERRFYPAARRDR
jgi:hypothetical protein